MIGGRRGIVALCSSSLLSLLSSSSCSSYYYPSLSCSSSKLISRQHHKTFQHSGLHPGIDREYFPCVSASSVINKEICSHRSTQNRTDKRMGIQCRSSPDKKPEYSSNLSMESCAYLWDNALTAARSRTSFFVAPKQAPSPRRVSS